MQRLSGDNSQSYSIDVQLLRKWILPARGGQLVIEKIAYTGSLHFFSKLHFLATVAQEIFSTVGYYLTEKCSY